MITMLSGREFNHGLGRAKRAANEGLVIITDRGKPAHVLLSFEEYRRITGKTRTLGDMLAAPGVDDVDLPLPARKELAQLIDLS